MQINLNHIFQLKEIIISPHYVGRTTNYVGNIAILVTERNFTMSYYVQPVCLDWTNSMDWVPNLTGIVSNKCSVQKLIKQLSEKDKKKA